MFKRADGFVDICSFGIGGSSIGQISDPDEEEKSPVFGLVFTGFGDQCLWRLKGEEGKKERQLH